MKEVIVHSRKHWTTYVLPIAGVIVGSVLLLSWFTSTNPPFIMLILGVPMAISGLYHILKFRSIAWELYESSIVITSGIILKSSYEVPIHSVYESFYTLDVIGKLIGFGNIHLKRNDGVGSTISALEMNNYAAITGRINGKINDLKTFSFQSINNPAPGNFIADEILKLKDLLNEGILSKAEFDREKDRILKRE